MGENFTRKVPPYVDYCGVVAAAPTRQLSSLTPAATCPVDKLGSAIDRRARYYRPDALAARTA